ncbi:hypothetical protein [Actinotalea sp. K2]|uniref:hypothetical protein n=1 Tax=Actinotalea sp. K2 TaxID=2939438 RepID=UPI0020174E22|nr:hypothetical protein [Actinotalea sp. K2]MCL3862087.1 hypothetical protein [Actinotalea sp. K2]
MTTDYWTGPARDLATTAHGWAGVWTLTYATGLALQRVAGVVGWDEDLTATYAGLDVALATSELAWADPSVATLGGPVDLGPAVPSERSAAVSVVLELLERSLKLLSALIADPTTPGGRVLSGTRALALLISADQTLRAGQP